MDRIDISFPQKRHLSIIFKISELTGMFWRPEKPESLCQLIMIYSVKFGESNDREI